jgi:hypothetical protein
VHTAEHRTKPHRNRTKPRRAALMPQPWGAIVFLIMIVFCIYKLGGCGSLKSTQGANDD